MTEPACQSIVRNLPPELVARADEALADFSCEDLLGLVRKAFAPGNAPSVQRLSGGRRWQDEIILGAVPPGARVLDLGCGCGTLLERLIRENGARGQGVEIDPEAVVACLENGIPVFQADLDQGLAGFPDQAVDIVILEETIQTLRQPTRLLAEVLRVGREAWISFPNFGCWSVRLALALEGRMPVTEELPYRWHDTPNIHLLTLRDFQVWAEQNDVRIAEGHALVERAVRALDAKQDNLFAEEVLLRIVPA